MAAVECPNRDVNLQMCPCTYEECDRKGVCCLCVQYHVSKGQQTACMRDTERPADTRALGGAGSQCDRYRENLDWCACDYEPCANRGTCCECIRAHWGHATYPATACMR